jgi:hypothetical protein
LPGNDQIPAELIQAGGELLHSEVHELINSISNMENLPDQWKESIIVPVHKKGDKTNRCNYRGTAIIQNVIEYSSLKAKSIHRFSCTYFHTLLLYLASAVSLQKKENL